MVFRISLFLENNLQNAPHDVYEKWKQEYILMKIDTISKSRSFYQFKQFLLKGTPKCPLKLIALPDDRKNTGNELIFPDPTFKLKNRRHKIVI